MDSAVSDYCGICLLPQGTARADAPVAVVVCTQQRRVFTGLSGRPSLNSAHNSGSFVLENGARGASDTHLRLHQMEWPSRVSSATVHCVQLQSVENTGCRAQSTEQRSLEGTEQRTESTEVESAEVESTELESTELEST